MPAAAAAAAAALAGSSALLPPDCQPQVFRLHRRRLAQTPPPPAPPAAERALRLQQRTHRRLQTAGLRAQAPPPSATWRAPPLAMGAAGPAQPAASHCCRRRPPGPAAAWSRRPRRCWMRMTAGTALLAHSCRVASTCLHRSPTRPEHVACGAVWPLLELNAARCALSHAKAGLVREHAHAAAPLRGAELGGQADRRAPAAGYGGGG